MPKPTQTANLRQHPLIRELLVIIDQYGLNLSDMVIFGSGPLLAKGLSASVHDLDVIVRGKSWRVVKRHGDRSIGNVNGARIAQFCNGLIQFSSGWVSDKWEAGALIDQAEVIQGIPFARLEDVLAYKQELNRTKDQRDIVRLRQLGVVVPTPAAAPSRPMEPKVLNVDLDSAVAVTSVHKAPIRPWPRSFRFRCWPSHSWWKPAAERTMLISIDSGRSTAWAVPAQPCAKGGVGLRSDDVPKKMSALTAGGRAGGGQSQCQRSGDLLWCGIGY